MELQTKSCQNCKKDFIIEPEDFNYYEKIKVPPPTWCPECRMARRLSCANSWSLFFRNCDKCGKRGLAMYPPSSKITIYCQPCWWADDWDGTEYGMDYDPGRPFLSQLKELSEKTPFVIIETDYLTLKNCEYSSALSWSKNCYLVVWADYCEDVYYSSILNKLRFSSDCVRGWDSELCYDSVGFIYNYRTFFSDECDSCVDVWFSRNCYGCTNCIGCVNIRNASYCIFNEKYSKEEYDRKVKEMKLDTWSGIRALEKQAREFWLSKPHREYHGHTLNLNVSGEYVYNSRNSKEGYIVNWADNCKWCQFITVANSKDCWDYSGWGDDAELIYDSVQVGQKVSNIKFSSHSFPDGVNAEYCSWTIAPKNNFGCINLKRKSYCILNKQYTKKEYETIKVQIIEDMKKNPYVDKRGRVWPYGEFPQPIFCKVAYNHSNAGKFLPKTKEQALIEGYTWDDYENPTLESTIRAGDLPETIQETTDEILKEIVECSECGRSYKIVQGELGLLRKMGLPVPHECPKCRENRRFSRMNGPGMYHRSCAKCNANIYTPYAPERPEMVYCVACYQQEFA